MTPKEITLKLTAEQVATIRQALLVAEEQYKSSAKEAAKEATTSVPHTLIHEYFETRATQCRQLVVLLLPKDRKRKVKR